MKDSQVALLFAATAILVTAVAMFRQGAIGVKTLAAVLASTIGVTAFLFVTLTVPQ